MAAFNKAINAAVLHGTNIPTTWTTNMGAAGLVALATAASQTVDLSTQVAAGDDIYDVIMGESGILSLIEADGFMANGFVGHVSMRGKLRGLRDANGVPIFTRSMQDGSRY